MIYSIVAAVVIIIIIIVTRYYKSEEFTTSTSSTYDGDQNTVENYPTGPQNVLTSDANGNLSVTSDLGLQHLTVAGNLSAANVSSTNLSSTTVSSTTVSSANVAASNLKVNNNGALLLGDKFRFNSTKDAWVDDDWLRMMNKDNTEYYGGFAAGRLWTRDLSVSGTAQNDHVILSSQDLGGPGSKTRINSSGIIFGGTNGSVNANGESNREVNSAQISAGRHEDDTLCIVGMSDKNKANRRVTVWAEGGMKVIGKLGINTSSARCPLEIGNSITVDPSGGASLGHLTNRNWIAQGNWGETGYAIIANGSIYSTSEVRAASDIRMKTNVIEIDCSEALNIVRKLKPSQYNYIDYMNKGTKPIYGFIAQEVEEVIDVVNKIEEFIPNIYKVGQIKDNIITLDSAHGLKQDDVVKMVYGDNNTNLESTVIKVINNNSFMIDADIKDVDQVFVYGVKVNDFRNITKDAIFSVSVAAIKQLDKENRELRRRLSLIEKKLGIE